MASTSHPISKTSVTEKPLLVSISGYALLVVALVLLAFAGISFLQAHEPTILSVTLFVLSLLIFKGMSVIAPNEAVITTFLGTYMGTMKKSGLRWVNPFYSKQKISLRARNLNGQALKVNDKSGNPIEIAAVVVWQVDDTARATFDVDDYSVFVHIQSEAAVRKLASSYAYDHSEDDHADITLRDSTGLINEYLERELNERLARAGVVVIEARISHLAYAPEIAQAMLQRQQAAAMIAARRQIVDGAVGMVEMALLRLEDKGTVTLDTDRKAALVSNLLIVLCGEKSVSPIVNTSA
ncbi:SPFH domain-containing protein [Aquirhabdus parva]|uniref:SPFH domain-containing protein n=1 Tax=Aquirhabdus parva TaxID=2283318 RepID=A0A345P2S9_9GAMM|nr:SPFH domain-containing protein [Aquirhabdus parva]AXI01588.1 SPFH domain-containing protein [Aquirhabdus parva]